MQCIYAYYVYIHICMCNACMHTMYIYIYVCILYHKFPFEIKFIWILLSIILGVNILLPKQITGNFGRYAYLVFHKTVPKILVTV